MYMYISIYIEIHAKEALPSSLLACHPQPTTTAACCSTTTLYHFNCTASSPHGLTPHGLALHTALRCMPGPLAKAMPGPPLPPWVNWEERCKLIAGALHRAPTVAELERLPGLAVSTPGFGDLTSFIRKPMSCMSMYVCMYMYMYVCI